MDHAVAEERLIRAALYAQQQDEDHPLSADLERLDMDGPVASFRLQFDWPPSIPDALPEAEADAAMEAAMQWAQQVMPPHGEGGDVDG